MLFLGVQFSPRRAGLLSDGDPCWHWLQGNWMLEHRAVLRADVLSHTRAGAPLVCKDWGSDVLWATAGNLGGWSGVVFLAAALMATTLGLLYRQLRAEGAAPRAATALTLLAMGACSSHWLARPHLWSQLLAVLVAWTLRAFDRDRLTARQAAWRLAALLAMWANLHSGFPTGLVMIGLYTLGYAVWWAVGAPAERPRLARRVGVGAGLLAVALAASLVNPNGWRLHAHILEFLRTPALALSTSEWQSPDFHSAAMHGFAALLLALLALLTVARPRLRPTDWVVLVGWVGMVLYASRNVAICALVVTPILAEHVTAAWRQRRGRLPVLMPAPGQRAGNAVVVALAVAGVLFVLAKPNLMGGPAWLVTELPVSVWPAEAVRFVRDNGDRLRGEMFNKYAWGGYLAQTLPGRKVFIDGRNDFYGLPVVREYLTVAGAMPDWEPVLEKYAVGWTILPRANPLNQVLAAHPRWQVVHTDAVATVYCRRLP